MSGSAVDIGEAQLAEAAGFVDGGQRDAFEAGGLGIDDVQILIAVGDDEDVRGAAIEHEQRLAVELAAFGA